MTGKQILITGATSGIGLAAAEALAALGANVTIVGRNETRTRIAAARVEAARRRGATVDTFIADLSSPASVRKVIEGGGEGGGRGGGGGGMGGGGGEGRGEREGGGGGGGGKGEERGEGRRGGLEREVWEEEDGRRKVPQRGSSIGFHKRPRRLNFR